MDANIILESLTESEKHFIRENPEKAMFKQHVTHPFIICVKLHMPHGIVEKQVRGSEIVAMFIEDQKNG